MEPTLDTTESTPIDAYWLVANVFAIIHLLEEKFGDEALRQIITTAASIEKSMREEAEGEPTES